MVQQSPEVAWANVVYFHQTGFSDLTNWLIEALVSLISLIILQIITLLVNVRLPY